jgi:hypothetical protein
MTEGGSLKQPHAYRAEAARSSHPRRRASGVHDRPVIVFGPPEVVGKVGPHPEANEPYRFSAPLR